MSYEKRKKGDILAHPLTAQLRGLQLSQCHSRRLALICPGESLRQSQRDDDRLTKWLDPTVRVLHASLVCLRVGKCEPVRDPLFRIHLPGILSRESDLCRNRRPSLSA